MLMLLKVIAVIPASGEVSGASLALVHMLLGLVSRFRYVEVVAVTSLEALKYPAVRRLRERGAQLVFTPFSGLTGPLYWVGFIIALFSQLKHGRFEVVHFSTPKTLVLMYPVARLVGRKLVLSLEGYPPYELGYVGGFRRVLGMFMWYAALRFADRVAACSEWLKQVCLKSVGGGNFASVYNPVDFDRFKKAPSESVGDESCVKLVLVSRLDHVKGVDVALRAVKCLRSRGINHVRLVVVGDGPEADRLGRLAAELGVEGLVKFTGFRADVERLIAAADIVLVPSRYEPFGMVAAEAGAAAKPIVASRVGGLREIVLDGETGVLFNPGDHEDLAGKIAALVTDADRAAALGARGRQRAEYLFKPERVAEKLIRVYLDALRS